MALTLCMGEDPFYVQYDQHAMRKHLVESFESGFLIPFPSNTRRARKKTRIIRTCSIDVYCTCRGIEEVPMIQVSLANVMHLALNEIYS